MNTLYVDPSKDVNGVGTEDSPYNTVNSALNAAVHPFTILIKKGTNIRNNDYINDTSGKLLNASGQMSYIGAYGDDLAPLVSNRPRWYMNGLYNPQIQSSSCRWLDISGIDFYNQKRIVQSSLGTRNIMLTTLGDADSLANVFIHDCGFHGDPRSNSMQSGGNQRICLFADSTGTTISHVMKVYDCQFTEVGSGVYIRGNTNFQDLTTNVGDALRSYGCSVINCTFVDAVNCAVLLHTIASKTSWRDSGHPMWSGFRKSSSKSYRWDKNGADAGFWMWRCNRVGGEWLTVSGMQGMSLDGMAFDIDGMCWDCGFRYCFSSNNVSCMMFVSGSNAGLSTWDPTKYTYKEWFYDRRMGSGNNIYEYIFSFNDGVQRLSSVPAGLDSNSEITATAIRFNKCQFNCQINNCTFIDTVSDLRRLLINSNAYNTGDDTIPALTMNSNLFFARYLVPTNVMNHVLYTNDSATSSGATLAPPAQMVLNKNLMYSDAWASGAKPDMSLFTDNGGVYADPYFEYLPNSAPSGFASAGKIGFIKGQSVALSGGMVSLIPDVNGNTGNNIGWLQ